MEAGAHRWQPWAAIAVGRGIATAVAKVDAADKGAVHLRPAGVTQHHELLMMRAAGTDPHVEQAFAPSRIDLLTEMAVLPLGKLEAIEVRPPYQPANDHPFLGRLAQQSSDLGTPTVEALVGIATPVREQEQVTRLHLLYGGNQRGEVLATMDQRSYLVALRPRLAVEVTVIHRCGFVAALGRQKKPFLFNHTLCLPKPAPIPRAQTR
jgi:hypothetical protein